jgi:uncharacterized protein (DUF1501 family)
MNRSARRRGPSRREGRRRFLSNVSLMGGSAAAGAVLGWGDMLVSHADEIRRRGKACILLWMSGGPSQFETFSPLEDHANGGETKAIATSVPGIHFAEHWPQVASVADRLAVIRSMTSKEGSHPRASYLLHTGYLPNPSAKHPTLGSIVASQIADEACDLPPVIRVGGRRRFDAGAGLLGMQWDPFELAQADRPPANSSLLVEGKRHRRRMALLDSLEQELAATLPDEVAGRRSLRHQATRMVTSSQMDAFDLEAEPASGRDAYGEGDFAEGCLLARRLVEVGVPFVEVVCNGWDTHQDNFSQVAELAGRVDRPFAALVADLDARGMLDDTLVIWMGEFGRTPRINPRAGRDHFPRSFNVVLAGGGVRGGQVIGRTDEAGVEVADRPVTVPDLFATVCRSLAIDPGIENMASTGRPIRLVDGGTAVEEVFGG